MITTPTATPQRFTYLTLALPDLAAIRDRYLSAQPNAPHDVVADIVTLLEAVNTLELALKSRTP